MYEFAEGSAQMNAQGHREKTPGVSTKLEKRADGLGALIKTNSRRSRLLGGGGTHCIGFGWFFILASQFEAHTPTQRGGLLRTWTCNVWQS